MKTFGYIHNFKLHFSWRLVDLRFAGFGHTFTIKPSMIVFLQCNFQYIGFTNLSKLERVHRDQQICRFSIKLQLPMAKLEASSSSRYSMMCGPIEGGGH